MTDAVRRAPPNGALLIVGSSLLFAGMALFAKAAATEIKAPEIGFVRAMFGVIACGLYVCWRPLRPVNWLGLLGRGSTGAGAVYLYFTAIQHLPVGIATLLNYTAPVFTALWCGLLFKERINLGTLGALFMTTVGLACVLRGKIPAEAGEPVALFELVGICGAVLSGLSLAIITWVRRTDGPWTIFVAFSIGSAIVSAPEALTHWQAPSMHTWLILGAMGALSVVAQVTMTYAMGFLSATLAGIINQLTPVASLCAGALVFHERFGTLVAIGIGLTLIGGVAAAILGSRTRRAT